jgi:serralysin
MPQILNAPTAFDALNFKAYANSSETTDAAANTSTTYSIGVGEIFSGSLTGASDEDWVSAELVAGESYVIWVNGTGNFSDSVRDTTLTIRNSDGGFLRYNNDVSSDNDFSLIQYTATETGTYYFDVDDRFGDAGSYDLRLSSNVFTMDEIAAYLTDFGWGAGPQLAFGVQTGGTISYNINDLTADGQQLANWAFEAWSTAMGITFVQTSSSNANILFDDNQSGAFAGPDDGDFNTGTITQSSVNISTAWLNFYGTTLDSYSYTTYVHEIGHALGLYHSGPYNGNATYSNDSVYLNDSYQATVMSYFSTEENTYVNASNVIYLTPMPADLLAMHDLYGTAQAYAGNTVWGSNSNIGGTMGALSAILFDGAAANSNLYSGDDVGFAIYDTGGIDTLNLSNTTGNLRLDMRAETASDVGGLIGNVLIARGTVIENAIGNSNGDTITGNAANNNIEGRMGNDRIDGGSGNDMLLGQNGSDTLLGGSGADFLGGGNDNDHLSGGIGNDTIYGASGNDTIFGNENNDLIYALSENDRIDGGTGNDTIWGGGGNDTVYHTVGEGTDYNFMGTGDDTFEVVDLPGVPGETSAVSNNNVWLGIGNDTAVTGAGNDLVYGMRGIDVITTNDGNDTVYSGSENDTVDGGAGDDVLWVGEGNDSLTAGDGNDLVYARSGNDYVTGGAGNDTMHMGEGRDTVFGGIGHDTIFGGDDNDLIFGGADDDFIFGGTGNDTVDMGMGNDTFIDTFQSGLLGADTITGGSGIDTFQFTSQSSNDTITDFEIGIDVLRLTQNLWAGTRTSTEVVEDFATATVGGVVFDFGGGRTISLEAVFDTTNLADDLALF